MTDFTLPRGPRPPRPAAAANGSRESRAILLATLVSLLLHAMIAWTVYDKSFGGGDWDELGPDQEYHIQRATRDMITDEPIVGGPGVSASDSGATGRGSAGGEGSDASLATVSQGLLGSAEAPSGGQAAPLVGGNAWRRASEVRPGPPGGTVSQASPKVDLPDNLLAPLPPGTKVDVEFRGQGAGTGARGGSAAVGAAEEMLAGVTPGPGSGGGSGRGWGVGAGDASGSVGRLGLVDRPGGNGGGGTGSGAGGGLARRVPLDVSQPVAIPESKLQQPEHLDDDFDYAVKVFDAGKGEPYARVDITPKRTLRKLRTIPRDVVFLIDVSGSVPQDWVKAVTLGVRDSLSSLNEGDRFNIVFFNEKPVFFSREGIQPVNDAALDAARKFLGGARSGGDTDVNQALARLMVRDVAVSRVYDLILFSDGVPTRGVMDTRELINLVTRDNDLAASIYCVGIGVKQNRQLLEFLAYRNRGYCIFSDNVFTAPNTIRDLLSRLRYPIMKEIRLSVAGLDNGQVFPRDVPNIHQGETFSIFGRYAQAGQFTMRLSGHNGVKPLDFTFGRDLKDAPQGDKQIAQDWAFWKLHHLYSELLRRGETPQLRAAIEQIRKDYGLKTLY